MAPTPNTPVKHKPSLALVVIYRSNRESLAQDLLPSVTGHFDEYVFCDTTPSDDNGEFKDDGSHWEVEKFLTKMQRKGHSVNHIRYRWHDDFAAAREFAFSYAKSDWRMYLDSDDTLLHGEVIKNLLGAIPPHIAGMFIKYDYAEDEQLPQMRLARFAPSPGVPAGAWHWTDAIHERLEYVVADGSALPQNAFGQTDDFWVKHKYKTPEEKAAAIVRNAVIAKREYETATDPKYKARLGRTIAMEHKMQGRPVEQLGFLEDLQKHYPHYPEGRQAAADLAKAHIALAIGTAKEEPISKVEAAANHAAKALHWAKKAGPSYEALVHHTTENWQECAGAALRGYGIPQQTTHEGWLFEEGLARVCYAEAVAAMGGRAEQVERVLNTIPPRARRVPIVAKEVFGFRAMIDRITILVPGTPQLFDENGGGGMLGGSEEAVVYLSAALAKLGRFVRVFTPLPPHRRPGMDRHGVDWQDVTSFNVDDEHGTLVVWRSVPLILNIHQEKAKGALGLGIPKASLWCHDRAFGVHPQVAAQATRAVNSVIAVSRFHAGQLKAAGCGQEPTVLSNGIVREQFEPHVLEWAQPGFKDPFKVIYSSSPDRGLVPLLKMWPRVKAAVPQATLDIYYDWSMLEHAQPEAYIEVLEAYNAVKHLGVHHFGGVGHDVLNAAQRRGNIWGYSHFTNTEVETFCISAVKAQACGLRILTSAHGALPEVTQGNAEFFLDAEAYEEGLIKALQEGITTEDLTNRQAVATQAINRFAWDRVAQDFSKVWTCRAECLAQIGVLDTMLKVPNVQAWQKPTLPEPPSPSPVQMESPPTP